MKNGHKLIKGIKTGSLGIMSGFTERMMCTVRGIMLMQAVFLTWFGVTGNAMAVESLSGDDGVYEFRISAHDLNCISFPFESISINTASDAEMEVKNGSIYVMPNSDEPITVFVTPAGVDDWNAMLRLIPADIRPRHVRINVDAAIGGNENGNSLSGKSRSTDKNRYEKTPLSHYGAVGVKREAHRELRTGSHGTDFAIELVNGFREIWNLLSSPDEYSGDAVPVDISSLNRSGSFCGVGSERVVDGFLEGDLLYLALLVRDSSGKRVECGKDVLGYAMLNTMTTFSETDRILLIALPADYAGDAE
jgi:hypothetical protein